jgi:hypothetical protein
VRFELDLLDDEDPFEIDAQAAHLFKHPNLGIDDIHDVWVRPALLPGHAASALADVRRGRRPSAGRSAGASAERQPGALSPNRLLRGIRRSCQPLPTRPMNMPMTPDEEHEFYARPENQQPQGPPRRRAGLTATVPVRFAPERLEEIRRRAEAEDRSVSSWIRRAVEHELHHVD